MDKFYLENNALYQNLVAAFNNTRSANVSAPQTKKPSTELSSSNMIVSARIRPLLNEDIAAGFPCAVYPRSEKSGVVDLHDLYNHPRGRPVLRSSKYQVDRLFTPKATTEDIYDNLVANLVPFAWNGGIGTLFAYGQTGSGKTFTVSQLEKLVAMSLMAKDTGLDGTREVYMTIIDLAGNSAYDLLSSRKPISILEDSFGVTQLAGATEHLVQDRAEVMNLIDSAASFRRTAPTKKNDASSRSHGICRIRIKDPATASEGLLYLVDLAGSEAARDVAVHGADRMRETREINMSLSVLKDCIRGKVESDAYAYSLSSKSKQTRNKPRVPFRQSALTKVLKHVFDPASSRVCRTVVIACVNPSLADVSPSKNTLRYAEMLRVQVPVGMADKTESNPRAPMSWTNRQLKEWVAKNSGYPPIKSSILAPTESGTQLLHLPAEEFENRCLKTPGVSAGQAKAFRSKLWQMHIDSQRASDSLNESAESTPDSRKLSGYSSRDLSPSAATVPFKDRIRPGMVVSWAHSDSDPALKTSERTQLAVILSPLEAVRDGVNFVVDRAENGHQDGLAQGTETGGSGARYLCGLVTPGQIAEAYEMNLWQQVVIDVGMMESEVILEYDTGTRYYYISV
ncbi:diatom spindle kinesin 1 [Talaromyces proteolyticus]|uniref:Diatom spindle kinesin 1 n=1 Tax=Talaromyces proteolyticus TaxID=1131652 RepID=A0AAD4L2F8_9EURO|nr:diatom spindle kinesin 1 [Talaromyces proteolyticus]KAH8705974.1 diatom spindle kinesin 1 [Talaromyces proteolyticus]